MHSRKESRLPRILDVVAQNGPGIHRGVNGLPKLWRPWYNENAVSKGTYSLDSDAGKRTFTECDTMTPESLPEARLENLRVKE